MTNHAMHDHEASLVGSAYVCSALGISRATLIRRIAFSAKPRPLGKLAGSNGGYIFDRHEIDTLAQQLKGES